MDADSLETAHEIGAAYRELVRIAGPCRAVARREHLLSLFGAGDDLAHFDLEGRLHRVWLSGASYQRGLDGRLRRVRISGEGRERSLEIELLDEARSREVLARVSELARAAAEALPAGTGPSLAEPLARARRANEPEALQAEAQRFARTYEPIPILPPDQNRALVIQLTSGCSFNRCAFCHLYRDASFSLKTPEGLRDHVTNVLALVGRALPLRRGTFLGQANALVIGQDKLLPLLDTLHACFSDAGVDASFRRFGAFVDAFTKMKSVGEFRELRERGVLGVALGLESGSPSVLEVLGKPAEADAAVELAARLHEAGIGLGIIVLVGAGGERLAQDHVDRTVQTIVRMAPRSKDRIYLSPLVLHTDSAYAERSLMLRALTPQAIAAQGLEMEAQLRSAGVRVPIARYDLRRFVY